MLEAIFKHFLLYTMNITWLSTVVISHIAIKNILQEDSTPSNRVDLSSQILQIQMQNSRSTYIQSETE